MIEPFSHAVVPQLAAHNSHVGRISDFEAELYVEDQKLYEAKMSGTATGPALSNLGSLQDELGGCLPPGLHILHGVPGAGKTALALQIASTCGCPALYITAEMSRFELIRRLVARVNEIYLGRLRTGEFAPDAMCEFRKAVSRSCPDLVLADGTQSDFVPDPNWIAEFAPIARGNHAHLVIVIDSVHAWARRVDENQSSEYDCLNYGLDALVEIAEKLRIPILGLAQRNRTSMQTGGMSASRGTSSFEYLSESVWDLSTDEHSASSDSKTVNLTLAKNRYGTAGKDIALDFEGRVMRFTAL
jgi:replicative DNA helicase